MPSVKGICRGILQFVTFALLLSICQAQISDYNRDQNDQLPARALSLKQDEFSAPQIASERQNGRVVTSIVTSYMLVTLPCDVSELPSSLSSLLPSQPGLSLPISGGNFSTSAEKATSFQYSNSVSIPPNGVLTSSYISLGTTLISSTSGEISSTQSHHDKDTGTGTGIILPTGTIAPSGGRVSTSVLQTDPLSWASSSETSSSIKRSSVSQTISLTSAAQPRSSITAVPVSTTSGTLSSSEAPESTVLPWTATIPPPEGVEPTTSVTWYSSDHKSSTTRSDGVILPIIIPVWVCGPWQILCKPDCIIPFLFCGDVSSPGPLGFPWAKPPKLPPKPKKPTPANPEDPEPSETKSTSSESSCTLTSTISPHCDQKCIVAPATTIGTSTSWTTECFDATCKPTVVPCSKTIEKTTTTTYSTQTSQPSEYFCGARDSFCLNCIDKAKLAARQVDNPVHPKPEPGDYDILDGPKGLTHPDTWPAGPDDWYRRMYHLHRGYCDGLIEERTLSDGTVVKMGKSTMKAEEFGSEPLLGGTGPLWGCSALLIITNHGIYTSHNWEIPNFQDGPPLANGQPSYPGVHHEEEFERGVLKFLKEGGWGYPGVEEIKKNTKIFQSEPIKIFIFTPSTFRGKHWGGHKPPTTEPDEWAHYGKIAEWTDFMGEEYGWFLDFDVQGYLKGPSHWANYYEGMTNPMDNYQPPWGLVHWRFHHLNVREVDGKEIKQPCLQVWYETHMLWENCWSHLFPPASPPPFSLGFSVSASLAPSADKGGSGTAGPVPQPTPINNTSTATSNPASSSSKEKIVVVVTATATEVVTEWIDTTTTIVEGNRHTGKWRSGGDIESRTRGTTTTALPNSTPSNRKPSKRIVRLGQQIIYKGPKHKALIGVYEVDSSGEEKVIFAGGDYDNGGAKDLPSTFNLKDDKGGELNIKFDKGLYIIYFESKLGDQVRTWTSISAKNANDPGAPWCEQVDTQAEAVSFD
ncbi:uncharacterized protein CTRU02_204112 [Colletotrichum truncatum]|uniref:Uncharacterized protein n=1 Tax=Colletotrichum truncatum TaxID=5467 RepID=A0ACC3ZB87_COLTU